MSTDMPPGSLNLESQLLSIMDVLVKAAVTEISQLFSESSTSLRMHLSQSQKENETLRMRMKVMRSELFSLRLQTRTNRPASRFSPIRGSVPKPRARSQVVIKPPEARKTVAEAASISLLSKNKSSSSATPVKQPDVETPDVILIKDEDDVGGCGPVGGHDDFGNQCAQGGVDTEAQNLESSCLTGDHEELRIVSVHGRGEGPLQEASDSLFTASELQAFSSLSPDRNVTHDSLLTFTAGANDGAPMRGMQDNSVGLARNSQLERNHLTALNPAVKTPVAAADGHVGHPSHVSQFPQQQNVFPHSINKSLDCGFCGKCFLSREDLIVHRATHTGEMPLPCSFCGKSFVNKTTLTIHMRIHTGEKPYACTQCGKRFTQNGSLKIHLRTHSGEKPYTCNQCTASFNNPSNLRRHMITHTNGVL
ncbi:zinc finger protein with KRAB and SCAN domains 1-like isoform X1 [Acanthopagrus latus]|uniref:zinc finger protein with KRAB and SCAN domains 1-like isoform X1 n=1 Tax=Acanthopagrus latus TaxID=8177 RepID=UPI00187BEC6C|nr:zinc finger protein with KRAB and SCAN domains 1-like isoform X1 [Acanthopagrus latus]